MPLTISMEHYMELVLRHHPYRIIEKDDDIYTAFMTGTDDERLPYVLENEEWTILMDNQVKQLDNPNFYRLWRRQDWELCDNKRKEACQRIDRRQAENKAKYAAMRQAVREDMIAKGVSEVVWNMLSAGMGDAQVEMMFNNIKK